MVKTPPPSSFIRHFLLVSILFDLPFLATAALPHHTSC
jgi:hypothetical protein